MKIIGYSIKLEIVQHKINNGEGVSKGILFAFFLPVCAALFSVSPQLGV